MRLGLLKITHDIKKRTAPQKKGRNNNNNTKINHIECKSKLCQNFNCKVQLLTGLPPGNDKTRGTLSNVKNFVPPI